MVAFSRYETIEDFSTDNLIDALQDRIEELEIDREFESSQRRIDMFFIAGFFLCIGVCIGMAVMKPNEHKRTEQAAIVGSPR